MTAHINMEELEIFPNIEAMLSISEDMKLYNRCKDFTEKNFGPRFLKESESFATGIQNRILGPDFFKG
jgi:hemerythrin-like domain-containing protein